MPSTMTSCEYQPGLNGAYLVDVTTTIPDDAKAGDYLEFNLPGSTTRKFGKFAQYPRPQQPPPESHYQRGWRPGPMSSSRYT